MSTYYMLVIYCVPDTVNIKLTRPVSAHTKSIFQMGLGAGETIFT